MTINHMQTCDGSIRCIGCGYEREIPGRVQGNPVILVEWKEGIAARHVCRSQPTRNPVRVMRMPSGPALDGYFTAAVRREMRA